MTDLIHKLKMGYSIAADGEYVAIGNPTSFLSGSITTDNKGSVELFKYSITTDSYYPNFIFYKYIDNFLVVLAASTSSLDETYLNADTSSYISGLNIELSNAGDPIFHDDSYGVSVDVSSSIVVIGNPYYRYSIGSNTFTGSCVDVYNLNDYPTGYISGTAYYPTASITNSFDNVEYSSFGESVSIVYSDVMSASVLVVGSSKANSNQGQAYIYTQSLSGNWNHYQTLSGTVTNGFFGGVVKIDPSGSNRIVIGNKAQNPYSGSVYVYELNTTTKQWYENDELSEDRTLTGSVNIGDLPPYIPFNQPSSSNYGNSVSIYGDAIIVGAPNDMYYYQYSASFDSPNNRGAVYFWKKCTDASDWFLAQKSFGNEQLFNNNNLGFSVDIFNGKAIATSVKDIREFSSSYIKNTILKKYDCNPDDTYIDNLGQYVLYTSSLSNSQWSIENVISKRKEYRHPYTTFGYSVGLTDDVIAIGSPLFLNNPIEMTSSIYDTINGYSYIYNFNDEVTNYHIGNVFYRDGKIILSNSGSIFDNLFKDVSTNEPKYDFTYKSSLTIYEKQILCRIEPGEFNYSTNPTSLIPNSFSFDIDNNKYFDFTDLDLIFKYITGKIYGSTNWWNYMTFTQTEQSLFNYYSSSYNISSSYTSSYVSNLESNYNKFDIDGNDKVNINDMYIFWKYFTDGLNSTELFKYIEPKSKRKTVQEVVSYIETNIGKNGSGLIKSEFFNFNYSSSIDPTGSYLAPYITSVGLYSGGDLVAVAKLAMPIKNTGELPLNILVKWDI